MGAGRALSVLESRFAAHSTPTELRVAARLGFETEEPTVMSYVMTWVRLSCWCSSDRMGGGMVGLYADFRGAQTVWRFAGLVVTA